MGIKTQVVEYNVSDATLARLRERVTDLQITDTASYKLVSSAIGECRSLRVEVESARKELKRDALEWGRAVDKEARRITEALFEIEEPLKGKKRLVDEEKERVRREKAEAERKRIEEEMRAKREAEEAERRKEQERIEAEQAAERERLRAEQEKLEQERAKLHKAMEVERQKAEEKRRVEEAELAAERKKVEAERQRLEEIERKRLAAEQAEREAKQKAEREAEEERKREIVERKHAELMESLKPDFVKLHEFANKLDELECAEVKTEEAAVIVNEAEVELSRTATQIRGRIQHLTSND